MNITPEQLSKADDTEFSKLAGEVLLSKPYQHNTKQLYNDAGELQCVKCKGILWSSGKYVNIGPCSFPDPILITSDNAYKWRDWAVEKFGEIAFTNALLKLKHSDCSYGATPFDVWIATKAQPRHYIEAACRCVINAKESK
jgi:hypothetical protein